MKLAERDFWYFKPLGDLLPDERARFYDSLPQETFHFGGADSSYFENPTLRVGILDSNLDVKPAEGYNAGLFKNKRINVFLERYYAYKMPGDAFRLQIVVRAKHQFDDQTEASWVAHTLAVQGVQRDYVNYLEEPIFSGLSVEDMLSLEIAVIFVSDQATDRILDIISSDNVKKGLVLAGAFNPIFGMVAQYVQGIGTAVLQSHKNRGITKQSLTLLARPGVLGIPLVQGTYVLIQPRKGETQLSFEGMRYNLQKQNIVVNDQPLERNHIILRVEAQPNRQTKTPPSSTETKNEG